MAGDIHVGLVGAGIQASRSPSLHTREAAALGMRYFYRLFDTDEMRWTEDLLERIIQHAEALGFAGLNVTHPYKQRVMPLMDEVQGEAAILGAVNTVQFREGRRIGHNTDWWGFRENLRRGLPEASLATVTLLGAGGAGSAVAYALLDAGARRLLIADEAAGVAATLVQRLQPHFPAADLEAVEDVAAAVQFSDGVVNATPIGMHGHPGSPLAASLLRAPRWVADVVYFPLDTQLLRDARAAGCATLHGGGMAVFQAVRAFELFSGVTPDAERMLAHFAAMQEGTA